MNYTTKNKWTKHVTLTLDELYNKEQLNKTCHINPWWTIQYNKYTSTVQKQSPVMSSQHHSVLEIILFLLVIITAAAAATIIMVTHRDK